MKGWTGLSFEVTSILWFCDSMKKSIFLWILVEDKCGFQFCFGNKPPSYQQQICKQLGGFTAAKTSGCKLLVFPEFGGSSGGHIIIFLYCCVFSIALILIFCLWIISSGTKFLKHKVLWIITLLILIFLGLAQRWDQSLSRGERFIIRFGMKTLFTFLYRFSVKDWEFILTKNIVKRFQCSC